MKSLPATVCKSCLDTVHESCNHAGHQGYENLVCKTGKVMFLFCQECPGHQQSQEWFKEYFDSKLGFRNLSDLKRELRVKNVIVNVITTSFMEPTDNEKGSTTTPESSHRFSVADIEDVTNSVEETGLTANVRAVVVNNVPLGQSCCPFETITVKTEKGFYPMTIIYDTASQITLCNYETGPLLIKSKAADRKVTISTINGAKAKLRSIHTLSISPEIQLEAILIPNLKLELQTLKRPNAWEHLDGEWAEQDAEGTQAQILLGADRANLFAETIRDKNGALQQTARCRLMKSILTGRYLKFRSCGRNRN